MTNIPSSTAKTAKQLAQDIARKAAQEPGEILKTAQEEVLGNAEVQKPAEEKSLSGSQVSEEEKAKIQNQGARQLQALENELKEIRMQKEQGKLVEQKQEQSAKLEAVQEAKPLVEPAAKQGRRMAGAPGPKRTAQDQSTRVEKPLPPSG